MRLTVKQVEKAIGLPAKQWAGKCYSIACDIVSKKLVNGEAVYGHWIGTVDSKSMFYNTSMVGFCRHGWILMKDGTIVDPTRWVFESKKPYIYIGKNDFYDRGGNKLRKEMTSPAPVYEDSERNVVLVLGKETKHWVKNALGLIGSRKQPNVYSMAQMFWLANLSLEDLEGFAKPIYEALEKAHLDALIPIDNRNEVIKR